MRMNKKKKEKKWFTSRFCVSSLRGGHANLLCIFPNLVDGPKTNKTKLPTLLYKQQFLFLASHRVWDHKNLHFNNLKMICPFFHLLNTVRFFFNFEKRLFPLFFFSTTSIIKVNRKKKKRKTSNHTHTTTHTRLFILIKDESE